MVVRNCRCRRCGSIMKLKKTWTKEERESTPEGKLRVLWKCPSCSHGKLTHRKLSSEYFPDEEFRNREAERVREYRRRKKAEIIEKAGT